MDFDIPEKKDMKNPFKNNLIDTEIPKKMKFTRMKNPFKTNLLKA